MAAGDAQAAEVGGGGARILDVLDHLLADHDVERALAGECRAQVELRVVEAGVLPPPLAGVGVAADLDRAQIRRPELDEVRIDGAVQRHALPLVGARARVGREQPAQKAARHRSGIGSGLTSNRSKYASS